MDFNMLVFKGRWGSVIHAATQLQDLAVALTSGWNKQKYLLGGPERPRDEEHSVRISEVDDAICSAKFWGYLKMVVKAGKVLEGVATWSEACPCHDRSAWRHLSDNRQKYLQEVLNMPSCPMSTRRAPECAAGALDAQLGRLFGFCNTELMMEIAREVPSRVDRATILQDFAVLRRQISFGITLKSAFWKALPWHLWGLGHHSKVALGIKQWCAHRWSAWLRFAPRGSQ